MFTRLDRNLLVRVERNLRSMVAAQDERVKEAITSTNMDKVKVERGEADRLHRDLRELTELRKRIEEGLPKVAKVLAPT